MKHLISSDASKNRIAKWILTATAVDKNPTWTEKRRVIQFGDHLYLVDKTQVFPCSHCGHFDAEWSAGEVLRFFEENFGIKPTEIEVVCSVAGYIGKG